MEEETRYNREKEFHDATFKESKRISLQKFYSITEHITRLYKNILKESCKNKEVLEYGCGTGSYAFFLEENGAKVIGIDISSEGIKQARTKAKEIGSSAVFYVMNAEKMSFADNSFDLICGTGILHHLDIHAAFHEISRTLRPYGIAVFVEPLGHNPIINFYRKKTPQMRTVDEHPLLIKDIELARDYFKNIDVHYFYLIALLAVPFRKSFAFKYLVSVLNLIDQLLFRMFPFIRKYAWQAVIVFSLPKK